jgi:hypothetical protein
MAAKPAVFIDPAVFGSTPGARHYPAAEGIPIEIIRHLCMYGEK